MQTTASRATRLRGVSFAVGKAGAAQFEPALRLPDSSEGDKKKDATDTAENNDVFVMTTFSPFNPGATHTIRQSSVAVARAPVRATAIAKPSGENAALAVTKKTPWPYRLPRFLQPVPGTTYALMHSQGGGGSGDAPASTKETKMDGKEEEKDDGKAEGREDEEQKKPLSTVQAILYGVPEPKEYRYMGEIVRPGEFLWKVLYGGEKKEGKKGEGGEGKEADEGEKGQKQVPGKVIEMSEWMETREKWTAIMEKALEGKRRREEKVRREGEA